jgi:hypothetical protein
VGLGVVVGLPLPSPLVLLPMLPQPSAGTTIIVTAIVTSVATAAAAAVIIIIITAPTSSKYVSVCK